MSHSVLVVALVAQLSTFASAGTKINTNRFDMMTEIEIRVSRRENRCSDADLTFIRLNSTIDVVVDSITQVANNIDKVPAGQLQAVVDGIDKQMLDASVNAFNDVSKWGCAPRVPIDDDPYLSPEFSIITDEVCAGIPNVTDCVMHQWSGHEASRRCCEKARHDLAATYDGPLAMACSDANIEAHKSEWSKIANNEDEANAWNLKPQDDGLCHVPGTAEATTMEPSTLCCDVYITNSGSADSSSECTPAKENGFKSCTFSCTKVQDPGFPVWGWILVGLAALGCFFLSALAAYQGIFGQRIYEVFRPREPARGMELGA